MKKRVAIFFVLVGALIYVSRLSGAPSASTQFLGDAQNAYADWMDASSIMAAIDSGLFSSYHGNDRSGWSRVREEKHEQVEALLRKVPEKQLSATDGRALRLIRKGIGSSGDEIPSAHKAHCQDAQGHNLPAADLRSALYACFEELGNHLRFEGKSLTRVEGLELLSQISEAERRKALFLTFIPLWKAVNGNNEADSPYRRLIARSASSNRASPVDEAAKTVGVQTSQIENWLKEILDAWRIASGPRMVEPWDYRYEAGKADRLLGRAVPRESLLPITQRYYYDLGADLKQLGILYDLDPRPGKAPLAYTDFVVRGHEVNSAWQPTVVYVSGSYARGGLGLLNELVHENGHAVHMMALHTQPAFMDLGDPVFYEAFADVPSWDTYDPAWQQKYLGVRAPEFDSQRALYSSVMLDVAWALFEIRMLHNPAADPNAVWAEITSRYLHIVPHPELAWWAVRVQLVEAPGYMVNYGLGAVITADIRQHIRESLGPFVTGNSKWYLWISERLLRQGMEQETSVELKEFLGRPVSPEALLADLRALGATPLN